MTEKQKRIIAALIDTAQRTTDLENVYNDKQNPSEAFSWEDVKAEFPECFN